MSGLTRRINYGNGHGYKLDGKKCKGVTTILSDGTPKPALIAWAANGVARFAADNLDLLASLEADARYDLLKGAHYRDRDKAAKRGTEVHGLAEQYIHGEEITVPEELVGHVDSYIKFVNEWAVEPVHVELVVGNRRHGYMGSLDLIATLADGQTWLLDIKTTRSGIYPETALQIAAYRHAEFYLDANNDEQPMPAVDACGAIWVRADGYDLIPLDCGLSTFNTFLNVQRIANFVKSETSPVGDALQPPRRAA